MSAIKIELDDFFNGLKGWLEPYYRYKKKTNRFLAADFNLMDYIPKDENTLSNIFADLLNPTGPHGQGLQFLSCFLDILRETANKLRVPDLQLANALLGTNTQPSEITVQREAVTPYIHNTMRRMDIVIENPHVILVLENKPFAGDQEGQLSDYIDNAEKLHGCRSALVYLSGRGDLPSPSSIEPKRLEGLQEQGRFFQLNYATEVRQWIALCIKESQAEKIRWFLRDLDAFITQYFKFDARGDTP